jgi:glycosyltransferase involved in cell wall biosynthesis
MRIAISTSVIQRGRSGIAQYVFALVKALLPHAGRHHIHLLVLEEDLRLFDFAAGKVEIISIKGTRPVNPIEEQFRAPVIDIAWHQFVLPVWLRKHKIDVVHVPSYRRMLYSAPCALVATIHDLAQFHVAHKYDWSRLVYARVIARRLAARQDNIIAISQSTARDIERFFHVKPDRIHVIYNGLDQERFAPGDQAQAKTEVAKRWSLDRPFFLYVSRVEHPAKNHARLIDAFNQFRAATSLEWQLAFVGSDWHGSDVIHAMAEQSPYRHDIRFLGFVEDAALPVLYRAAEAMVYPSLFEGFGIPPVEAMSCGCPVLSSRRGSLDEVLDNSAGTFDPERVDEIVEALKRVAGDFQWRAALRDAGLRNARRFSWRESAERVLDVYEQAVERRHRSAVRAGQPGDLDA